MTPLPDELPMDRLLHYPWLLFPAVPVLVVVIPFNFLGDALRDAADPYSDSAPRDAWRAPRCSQCR